MLKSARKVMQLLCWMHAFSTELCTSLITAEVVFSIDHKFPLGWTPKR